MTSSLIGRIPEFSDVEAAADVLRGHAIRTPLLENQLLNQHLGGRLLIKAEVLQVTGSFKFRGAYNRLSWIDEEARSSGVVAYSSGNHAQGVAAAAGQFGVPATIVMPSDAPKLKISNTQALGAEVVFYDRWTQSREEIGESLAEERGATLVRPYDDPDIIAGQGTVGLEIAEQADQCGADLDAVLVPCGGGGLSAGCALALAEKCPETSIHTVEPNGFDDTAKSLAQGRHVENQGEAKSFCDALLAPTPGQLTFAVNRCLISSGLSVSDDEVAQAMAAAQALLKIVVEPGGAVALAAALFGHYDCRGKTVAVVCSGGNVDQATYRAALELAER